MVGAARTTSEAGSPRVASRTVDLSFDAIVAGARDGAPWALQRLFEALGPPVLGYLRGRGGDDPDGLANEVFLRVFRNIGRFDGGEGAFRSWVFTVAHNVLVDDHRSRRRRVDVIDLTDRAGELVGDLAGGDAEDEAIALLSEVEVARILHCLTDEQRDVVLLRVVADLPVRDVARITGRAAPAVRAMQHRALQAIRRELTRHG